MDQQLIKDTIKVLKDFGKFWTELYKITDGLPSLVSKWNSWDAKSDWDATKAVFTGSSK